MTWLVLVRVWFSISIFLILAHRSLSDFVDGTTICYAIAGLQNKIFEMTYSRKVQFNPEKLSMNIIAFAKHPTFPKVFQQEMNYTITKYNGGCSNNRFDAIALTNIRGYTSYFFMAFYYGEYLVEHFKIILGEIGLARVEGVLERASLKIMSKVQENLDTPRSQADLSYEILGRLNDQQAYQLTYMNLFTSYPAYIVPISQTGIELPKMAIIKMTLVDNNGQVIEAIPPIADLVHIEISDRLTDYSKLYYTTDLKLYDVDIKILGPDGKEIARALYSLQDESRTFDDSFKPKSTVKLFNYELTEITGNEIGIALEVMEEYVRFVETTSTLKECEFNNKKAYVIEHALKGIPIGSESLCTAKTKEIPEIHFLRRCTFAENYACLNP